MRAPEHNCYASGCPACSAAGFRDGLEAAAKVCEEECVQIGCTALEADGVVRRTRDALAAAIRTLSPSPTAKDEKEPRECAIYKGHYPKGACPATECQYPICIDAARDSIVPSDAPQTDALPRPEPEPKCTG